jgi:hypothetical protein
MDNYFGNDETKERDRISSLILAIQTEMQNMTPKELERLYTVIRLMEKKTTAKKAKGFPLGSK